MEKQHQEEISGPGSRRRGSDSVALSRVGKKPVLKRNFGSITILVFSCTVLITWERPVALVYGFLVVWIGTLSVFATLSELVSMALASSGQDHWVSMLAPRSMSKALSYVTASGAYITATLIQGVIVVTHPSYLAKWKSWHGMLMYWGVILIVVFINTVVAKWLPKFEGLLLPILGFFAVIVPLLVLAEHTDSEFVFKTWIYDGGWSSNGLSICIGMMGNFFAFLGGDAAIHMAEEIHNATTMVPRSILLSVLINGCLGFAMMLATLYCMSDLDLALGENPMYSIMSISRQALNSVSGAAAMSSVIIGMSFSATTGVMVSAGLPGWTYLQRVDRRTGIPLHAVVVTSVVAFILSLVNIGDPLAFNGVMSLTIAALFGSYLIPSALLLYHRCVNTISDYDPDRLKGVFGLANIIFACCFLTFVLFFSFWPNRTPVTLQNMNWAILVTGVVVVFSTVYYLV
ncbi:hypothetical protein P154DRAFT_545429 [Amniculicola lignicola CBS 123094]|uniref:Choline transport protein n=1 Tax=Amniculicola lignicola CBS 123094 TaxID=1392246 RepID=A0A6A5WH11_9PLEO|nr:hypothetical protein P154DRAFT_545429 [Amniculicola lignicola CBS 123094]